MNIDEVPVCRSVFKMEGRYYIKVSENMALALGNKEPIIILPSWPLEPVRDWKGAKQNFGTTLSGGFKL